MLIVINIIGALILTYLVIAEIRDTRNDNAEAQRKYRRYN